MPYYDEGNFKSVCYYRVNDKTLFNTTDKELAYRVNGAIFIKNGRISLIPWSKTIENTYKSKKGEVLSSGPMMIYKGKVCNLSTVDKKFCDTKHPRSAIAITKYNKLLLVSVDGRFPKDAIGINIPELTQLLKLLGCRYALNLDGGRSTTLWSYKEPDNGVLNCPAANKIFDKYGERYNSNTIIIYKSAFNPPQKITGGLKDGNYKYDF